mmetsp:Transcript_36311/g.116617  ORF Transcript_36311/g.116617 Transcript_36311/m.116617 type:complete len:206 (-) Transcript_36311:2031-2648(-)
MGLTGQRGGDCRGGGPPDARPFRGARVARPARVRPQAHIQQPGLARGPMPGRQRLPAVQGRPLRAGAAGADSRRPSDPCGGGRGHTDSVEPPDEQGAAVRAPDEGRGGVRGGGAEPRVHGLPQVRPGSVRGGATAKRDCGHCRRRLCRSGRGGGGAGQQVRLGLAGASVLLAPELLRRPDHRRHRLAARCARAGGGGLVRPAAQL